MQSAYAERKKRAWEDTVVLDLSRTRKLILMKPNFISREIVRNFLRKKVTFIRLQFVGCQSISAKATLGNGSYAETKRCGNRKLIQFLLLFQKKKSILGRYINTLFFITKDTNDSLILRMWCLCFFFFRGKNLPDTSCEICVDAGLSEFMRVMLYLGQNLHLLKQTFLAWRLN